MSTKRYTVQTSLLPVLTMTLVLAWGTFSHAEDGQKTWEQSQGKQTGQSSLRQRRGSGMETMRNAASVQRASNLLDMDVQNRRGETIGQIEDMVLTEKGDKIGYLVLSMDEERTASRLAIPSDRLLLARDGQSVTIKGTASSLGRKYSVGKDEWPEEVGGRSMLKKDAAEKRRVSDVLGMRVQGSDDEEVGQIEDLLVDLNGGQIKQAAIASGGFLGFNEKLSTIEWTTVNVQNGVASVNMTQQRLEQSATDSNEYWQKFGFEGEDGRNWQGVGARSYRDEDDANRRYGARSNRYQDYDNRRIDARSNRDEDDDYRRIGTGSYRDEDAANRRSGARSYRDEDDDYRRIGTGSYRDEDDANRRSGARSYRDEDDTNRRSGAGSYREADDANRSGTRSNRQQVRY